MEFELAEVNNQNDTSAEDLPQRTIPNSFHVQIQGWENDNEAEARTFGEHIMELAKEISRYHDLSRLSSVVIGMNYPEALASVDVGDAMPAADRTKNEYGEGGAMSVSIKKDGDLWNTVVIWTGLVRNINDVDHPDHKLALQTFLHEMIHVEDQRIFDKTFPGGWQAAKARDGRDAAMQLIVNPCQSEYSAQRQSAHIAPESGLTLLDMLESAMRDVDDQITSARRAYRTHGDVERFWTIARDRLRFLFQAIGYGLGHADYIASDADKHPELAKEYANRLEALSALPKGWLLGACRDAVQPFFLMKEWTDMTVYDPLEAVLDELLNQYGVFTSLQDGSLYLDMPYNSFAEL
ncbi:hypothetical protein [Meridianimarinicoccus aquatilis]|uniref:Uncharacterized protein n=1 Tax=Meridianimarinicoccus aquatilis TaxID=2552766 RepID=A0A4R6ARA0_9RHOB|nr:hypothetical protein [Fluviibacterium aquatile]TDL84596.1 hypothetical protein E2L05_17795 [Fluviibacterium aquatile]